MKALIRNRNEIVCETDGIDGINWNTGAPLTNPVWSGGPYKLVDDYDPQRNKENIVQPEHTKIEEEIVDNDDYVVIEGKRYSKEDLRSLLK